MSNEPKEIIETPEYNIDDHGNFVPAMTPGQLQKAVDDEVAKREILVTYVRGQLKDGTDFGSIPVGGRTSKPTLFKPGMEKVLSLMSLQSKLEVDEDTMNMLKATGFNSPVVAYKCTLTRSGQFLAEGRGAAEVGERKRDVNSTIKIAEKRARMDATLSLGFSEFFTQDLDDMPRETVDYQTGEIGMSYGTAKTYADAPDSKPASDKQIALIKKLMKQKLQVTTVGQAKEALSEHGITHGVDELTMNEARKLIDYLIKYTGQDAEDAPAPEYQGDDIAPDGTNKWGN